MSIVQPQTPTDCFFLYSSPTYCGVNSAWEKTPAHSWELRSLGYVCVYVYMLQSKCGCGRSRAEFEPCRLWPLLTFFFQNRARVLWNSCNSNLSHSLSCEISDLKIASWLAPRLSPPRAFSLGKNISVRLFQQSGISLETVWCSTCSVSDHNINGIQTDALIFFLFSSSLPLWFTVQRRLLSNFALSVEGTMNALSLVTDFVLAASLLVLLHRRWSAFVRTVGCEKKSPSNSSFLRS